MRKLLAVSLLLAAAYTVASAASFPEVTLPQPKAYTVEDINNQIRMEKKEKVYQATTRVIERVFRTSGCGVDYARSAAIAAVDAGLTGVKARLFAGLIITESFCNPKTVSVTGDVGLTQLHAKFHRAWTVAQLLDPDTNLHIGAKELASHFRKYGLVEGLHRYNGFGNPTLDYPRAVYAHAGMAFSS
jgi:soluble lytic murein transglycosylase-like protein